MYHSKETVTGPTAEICERIWLSIAEKRLRPGARLKEEQLAEIFDVSRARVRQALSVLESDGLVTIVPNRGAFVSEPGVDEARDVLLPHRPDAPVVRHARDERRAGGAGSGDGAVGLVHLLLRWSRACGQGEGDDLRIQPFNHRAGLRARSAMRSLHFRRGIALLYPPVREPCVVVAVKFAGRVVADIQQILRGRLRRGATKCGNADQRGSDGGLPARPFPPR